MRSYSSDAVPSSSFIFVQPATPTSESTFTPSSGYSAAVPSSKEVLQKPRRTKMFGFTPAHGGDEEGPHSIASEGTGEGRADSVEMHDHSSKDRDLPLAFSIADASIPLIPIPFRQGHQKAASEYPTPTPSSAHVNGIRASFPRSKTAMLRKKSGELVRSSLKTGDLHRTKPRSEPSTPTCPKYVHFDTQLEHVKHFLAQQKPAAVSRSGSPVETETEDEPEAFPFPAMAGAQAGLVLKLPNFPSPINPDQDAYLESLEIASEGKSLRGIVRVRNLAFEKWVAIRFTLDHWQTVSEVSAEHHETMSDNSDKFVFTIRLQDMLAKIEEKTMFIAIRYTVGGREIWDNNGGQNYKVEFGKRLPQVAGAVASRRPTWSVTNAGQAADRMADLRRELDRLVGDDLDPSPPVSSTRGFTEGAALPAAFSNRYEWNLKSFAPQAPNSSPPKPRSSALPLTSSPPKSIASFNSTIVGGMPATTYIESNVSPRQQLPYPLTYSYNSPTANSGASRSDRPPSPPTEAELSNLYSGYGSPEAAPSPRSRYHTYPGSFNNNHHNSPQQQYAPMLPPSFRSHRRRDSPFASPIPSPVPSPARSPLSNSPPRPRSPPLFPTKAEDQVWTPSPPSSLDTQSTVSTTTSRTYSPDSEATSMNGSPVSLNGPRGALRSDFSSFLDRVRRILIKSFLDNLTDTLWCFSTASPLPRLLRHPSAYLDREALECHPLPPFLP